MFNNLLQLFIWRWHKGVLTTWGLFLYLGKVIKTYDSTSRMVYISDFASGIYFLDIANADKREIIKITKK